MMPLPTTARAFDDALWRLLLRRQKIRRAPLCCFALFFTLMVIWRQRFAKALSILPRDYASILCHTGEPATLRHSLLILLRACRRFSAIIRRHYATSAAIRY